MRQNTNEWLEFRKTKIGASDAPVIDGVSPWSTPYMLWRIKMGLDTGNFDSPGMSRGRELEEPARKAFEAKTGVEVFPQVMVSKTHGFMMASYDGLSMEGDKAVEIKCPSKKDHFLAQKGVIPDKYIPQLQHQMHVGNLPMIFYWSFDGVEGVLIELQRDDSYLEKLIEKETKFYEHMLHKTPPDLTERDYEKRDDQIWVEKEKEWVEAQCLLKEAQEREKLAREDLLSHTDRNVIGELVKATKYFIRGRVDYNKIPELIGVDLDAYRRKDTECWRLSHVRRDV